ALGRRRLALLARRFLRASCPRPAGAAPAPAGAAPVGTALARLASAGPGLAARPAAAGCPRPAGIRAALDLSARLLHLGRHLPCLAWRLPGGGQARLQGIGEAGRLGSLGRALRLDHLAPLDLRVHEFLQRLAIVVVELV